jgi:DNA-binding transcriptional MerR regulator
VSPRGGRRLLTIGAVLAALSEEFPDVSISKIRFLEGEGLVAPGRTPAGYRTYTPADVDRLRYILTAQRDRFWPLKVIKDALDALDRGLTPSAGAADRPAPPTPVDDPDVPSARDLGAAANLRLTAHELAGAAQIDPALLDSLTSFGLVAADKDGHYDEAALSVAHAAGQLAAYGLEPRHLRTFRTAADRELGLVEQALAAVPGGPDERADHQAVVARACVALHVALVKSGLRRGV